jgi:acyl-CoA reductase-like NAD-dependent aldehyde dehydrogenase
MNILTPTSLTNERCKVQFAAGEVEAGIVWISELAKLDLPEEIIEDTDDRTVITRYTPLGVVAAIVPWNFPIQLGLSLNPILFLEFRIYSN